MRTPAPANRHVTQWESRSRFRHAVAMTTIGCGVLVASTVAAAPLPPPSLDHYPDSLEEVLSLFPTVDANPTARDLEELTAEIGIDLAPKPFEPRRRPTREDARAFDALKGAIGEYLAAELERSDSGTGAPPEVLASFLSTHRTSLEGIRDRLLRGDPPQWERRLERLWEAPIPNLLGHITLHKLFVAAALERAAAHDREGALRYLDASWQLNRSLRDEPMLITQLIAVSATRLQAGALRRIPDPPASWLDRIREHDYRRSLTTALWLEGWVWKQTGKPPDFAADNRSWTERTLVAAGVPYFRWCLEDASERWRRHLERVAQVDSLCGPDLQALDRELLESTPWWNRISNSLYSNLAGSLSRVARLELDLELTAAILDLESRRREAGAWPASYPIETSSACPDARWRYALRDDGGFSLALDRKIEWAGEQMGVMLPTRYDGAGGAVGKR